MKLPRLRRLVPLLAACALPAAARAQIPADAHWRVIDTPHFRVHFTPGLEPLARRAGADAETAWTGISAVLVHPPARRVDLVLTDNVDYSNGFATPFPRNRVVVFAHPPVDDPGLAFYDDWLQLVITHELTHIFHLDYARGLPLLPRKLVGRDPVSFPETTTPSWTKEGLAVYLESRLTGAGRIRGTQHEMEIRTAVLDSSFFTLDRASGDPVSWPGGSTPYVYGSLFIQYLADRYGPQAAGEFVRRYGGQALPWLMNRAARRSFGVSFSQAWRDWRASLEQRYRAQADSLRAAGLTQPQVLTRAGRDAEFPRWMPDGRGITYAAATGREEAQQRIVDLDGHERVLAPRTSLGPAAWSAAGSALVTSMIDLRDPFHAVSDLYRIGADGSRARLTEGARLLDPDLARDGRVVAIRSGGGTTVPVLLATPSAPARDLAAPDPDVNWAFPRWSPDGGRIALSRWRRGGYYDVVIIDTTGRVMQTVTDDRAVDLTPAWSPDGRWLLFSSDRTGIANLYAWDTREQRLLQVTNLLTGGSQPDVSPDGGSIAFQFYQSDGYHIARIPFDPAAWRPAPAVRAAVAAAAPLPPPPAVPGPPHRYWALRSALPAYWEPTWYSSSQFGTALGVATSGSDVVERHLWALSGQVYPRDGRVEGGAAYLFRGLGNPALGVSAFQDWDLIGVIRTGTTPGGSAIINSLLERTRSFSAVSTFSRPRYRSYAWLSLGGNLRDRLREWADPDTALLVDPPMDIGAVSSFGVSTARAFAYSISTEQGFVAAGSVEGRRFLEALPGESVHRGYTRVAGRLQGYQPLQLWGFAHHVVAARAVGGADFGSRTQYFSVGGVTGDAVAYPLSTGTGLGGTRDLFLRGYPDGAQFGDRAVAGTAEWRFPLALVQRGVGLVPVFLDRLWGSAFADAGTAWCVQGCQPQVAAAFPRARALVSVGAELGGDFFLGFNGGVRVRAGVALPLSTLPSQAGPVRPRASTYLTFGQSF